uniref:Folate receptor-like domain-containing protein n=1 Tax=Salix viminalis TaxID=40686 RepID=A0A6N2KDT7_SALVM
MFVSITMAHFVNVGKLARVCVSKGGRFPPYSSEGKPPKKVGKGARDLTLCRLFHKKTCCDVAQTYPASLSVRRLASTGEASQECLQLWELLECSICDPQIGVQPGPPLICASFCDRVYQACASAYFSMDANKRLLNGPMHRALQLRFAVLLICICYVESVCYVKRKSHSQSQRQKLAAIQIAAIAARRQDGRMSENSPDSSVNMKGNRR